MEKQLLYLLDYDLAITTEEVHTRQCPSFEAIRIRPFLN